MTGNLILKNANVDWTLSTNYKLSHNNIPIRKITFLNKVFNLSNSKLDLHEISYKKILSNKIFYQWSQLKILLLISS